MDGCTALLRYLAEVYSHVGCRIGTFGMMSRAVALPIVFRYLQIWYLILLRTRSAIPGRPDSFPRSQFNIPWLLSSFTDD